MAYSSRGRMKTLLKVLCLMLLAIICFFLFSVVSGTFALTGAGEDSQVVFFLIGHCISGLLVVVPLFVFIRLVWAVVRSKEFFSRAQSKRMLSIAVCFFASRRDRLCFAPSIEVPNMLDGAIGPMYLEPSLNLMTLAISLMLFALAGVFEYGRKLQEDSDNIL